MNENMGSKIADWIIIFFITLGALLCLVPFIYLIALSLSSNSAIISQKVGLWPVEFTTKTYDTIFHDKEMIYTLFYTVILTFVSTVVSMFLTICAAFPLTKKNLKGRNVILVIFVITMYFSGGMIPDYMLVKNLTLLNKVWSLILPGAINVFYMIILKTFFSSLPASLEESAALEGCGDMGILFRIVLPLSLPSLATLSLFYAVNRWNGFQDALMYITDRKLFPMQLKLYQIITESQQLDIQQSVGNTGAYITPEALKAGAVIFATVPILMVYPWLQKYFVHGVMTGAIKG